MGDKGVVMMQQMEAEEAAVRQAAVISSYRAQMDKVKAGITGMEEEAEEMHQLIDKVRRQENAIDIMKDTVSGLILLNSTVYPRLAQLQISNVGVLIVELKSLVSRLKRDVDSMKKVKDSSRSVHSPGTVDQLAGLLDNHEKGQENIVLPLLTDAMDRTRRGLKAG